jgi:hypothetical protein
LGVGAALRRLLGFLFLFAVIPTGAPALFAGAEWRDLGNTNAARIT